MRVIVNKAIVSNKLLDRYITKSSNNELILLQLNKDLPNFLAGTSSTNCVLNIPELKFIGCFFESSIVFLKLSDKPEEITLTIHLRRMRCQQKPSGCPHAKRPGNKAEGLPLGVVSSPSRGRPPESLEIDGTGIFGVAFQSGKVGYLPWKDVICN